MAELKRLPDAELAVMQALWQAGRPLTRPELEAMLAPAHAWAPTTVLNLAARLEGKGFVTRRKAGRGNLIEPLVTREEYLAVESRSALERMFGGSARNRVAALHQCHALSRQEIRDLTDYLETLSREETEG